MFYNLQIIDDGKNIDLTRQITPFVASSNLKYNGKDDEKDKSKLPSSASIMTYIETEDESELISIAVDDIKNTVPNYEELDTKSFNEKVAKRLLLLKSEFLQWKTEKLINDEFMRFINSPETKSKLKYGKTLIPHGCIQYTRNYNEKIDKKSDGDEENSEESVLLEKPIIRIEFSFDREKKPGDNYRKCWTTFNTFGVPGTPMVKYTKVNTDTNEKIEVNEPVHADNITHYIKYGYVCTGTSTYKLTTSTSGVVLHQNVKKMTVKPIHRIYKGDELDEETADLMDSYGDMKINNGGPDPSNYDTIPTDKPAIRFDKPKNNNNGGMSSQLNNYDVDVNGSGSYGNDDDDSDNDNH